MGRRKKNRNAAVDQPLPARSASQRVAEPARVSQQEAAGGSSKLLAAAAILSTVALLTTAAYLFFTRSSDAERLPASPAPVAGAATSAGSGSQSASALASVATRSADQSGAATATLREDQPMEKNQPVAPTDSIELNREPIFGATEPEQQRLLAAVEKSAETSANNARVQYIAALTYAELLQTERASQLFQRSLELDDSQSDVIVDYGQLLLSLGQQDEAIAVLSKIADPDAIADMSAENVSARALNALGEAFSQNGDLERATQTLQRAVLLFPEDGELHLQLAKVQNQNQAFAEAEEQARRAIELGVTDRAAYVALSTALVRSGRQDEALEVRAQLAALTEEPRAADSERYRESFRMFASNTYAMLGQAYVGLGTEPAAEDLLRDALRLDPTSIKALVTLGDICHRAGRAAETLSIYQRLIEVQPDNLVNYSNCATLAIAQRNLPLAEKVLQQAAERDERGYANLFYARLLMELGRFDEAANQAELAAQRSADVDAYLTWIAALQQQGKSAQALEAWLQARKIKPNDRRLANVKF